MVASPPAGGGGPGGAGLTAVPRNGSGARRSTVAARRGAGTAAVGGRPWTACSPPSGTVHASVEGGLVVHQGVVEPQHLRSALGGGHCRAAACSAASAASS